MTKSAILACLAAGFTAGCATQDPVDEIDQQVVTPLYAIYDADCAPVTDPGGNEHSVQLQVGALGACAGPISTTFEWVFHNENGLWQIRNAHSGLCMSVLNASQAQSAQVIQTSCNNNRESLWAEDLYDPSTSTDSQDGIRLRNAHSGRCLNIEGGVDGTKLIQWTCGTYLNELMFIVETQ